MTTFLSYQNNYVTALIREDQLTTQQRVVRETLDPVLLGIAIFTFVTEEAWDRAVKFMRVIGIKEQPFFTGTLELMNFLLQGHTLEPASMLYVPFSNRHEFKGNARARWERQFRTTPMEVFEAFELSRLRPPALVAHT